MTRDPRLFASVGADFAWCASITARPAMDRAPPPRGAPPPSTSAFSAEINPTHPTLVGYR